MKFTKKIEKLERSAVKLTVTVEKNEVAESYKTTLAKYVKQVQIPGFRKGHVPANVLERKYGEHIKTEAAGDIIDNVLNEFFADEKEAENRPLPYEQPKLTDMPVLDMEKDFEFSVTYDVFPKVSVKDFSGITVKEPQVTVSDDDIQEELKAIQERNAVVMDKDDDGKVEKDNIVTINIVEKDENGAEIESTKRDGFVFTVGTEEDVYRIDDEITGMKKNESKEITKKYPKSEKDPELAGKTKTYSVTVTQIKVRDLPPLDDDLAQDVNEKFKTLADLKNDITAKLNAAKDRKVNEVKIDSLLTQLVEKNVFEIPESMLNAEIEGRWQMMAQQFQTTPEDLERLMKASGQNKEDIVKGWTSDAEKMLKSRIIVDSLIKDRNISVTADEIEESYKKIAENNGISVEEVKKHYADPRSKEYLIDDAKEQKLYTEIFKEVKVSKGDKMTFAELFKQQN